MIAVEDTMLVLLAAGASERFGDIGCKLEEEFLGKPLGVHVAVALGGMPFKERVAVVNGGRLDYARYGFRVIENPDAAEGLGSSVRIGATCAREAGAAAMLIALADMPRVTAAHIHRLFDASEGDDTLVASSDAVAPKPPVLFGRGHFAILSDLAGQAGARDLVRSGRHVVTTPAELIDIDTPEELAELRRLVHDPVLTRGGAIRGAARRSD